jgi:hypothetical protein
MDSWINSNVINAGGNPSMLQNTFSNLPTNKLTGQLFVSTDTFAWYRNNGSSWDLIGGPGTGTITGSGTNGTIPKFTGAAILGDSIITENAGKITISGNLNVNNIILNSNTGITKTFAISQTMATNDIWEIYGIGNNGSGIGEGELIFSLGDDGMPFSLGGERFRFTYGTNIITGTAKDVLIIDYLSSVFNTTLEASSFIKTGSSDSFFLLGGGGTVATSNYALTTSLSSYLPLIGGNLSGVVNSSSRLNLGSTDNVLYKLNITGNAILTGTLNTPFGSTSTPSATNSAQYFLGAATANTYWAGQYYSGATSHDWFVGMLPDSVSGSTDSWGAGIVSGGIFTKKFNFDSNGNGNFLNRLNINGAVDNATAQLNVIGNTFSTNYFMNGGGYITGSAGYVNINAGGTNQNINLTPSGTGYVNISTSLQLAANLNFLSGGLIYTTGGQMYISSGLTGNTNINLNPHGTGVVYFSSNILPTVTNFISLGNSSDYFLNSYIQSGFFSGRVNVNGATDNSLFALNVSGTINGSSPSFTGNSYTVTATLTAQFYHVFTGAVGQTLTVPTPVGNNSQYLIVNNSANILTVAAFSGTNIVTLAGLSSSTITLAANARTLIIADGNNKYYQAF